MRLNDQGEVCRLCVIETFEYGCEKDFINLISVVTMPDLDFILERFAADNKSNCNLLLGKSSGNFYMIIAPLQFIMQIVKTKRFHQGHVLVLTPQREHISYVI